MSKRIETLAYMVPQPQAAISKAEVRVAPAPRAAQKRWPMALSIWAAVAVSLALWAGLAWIVSLFMSLFS
ncbi:MAG: hypothetical protein IPL62_04905 [Caulobacteraceae bacterium]|nr:hypothetical protein [Caulobacteraceae bacterium]MBP6688953.1 hypothetical protein [Hyphomonadaceae bacterium]